MRLLTSLFSLMSIAYGATHYITPAGAGSKNGTNWSNAYQGIPATLTRGDTYVLAGGTYGSYSFDDALSGTTYIYLRKAKSGTYNGIAYNDDLVSGWSSSYENSQAVVSSGSSKQWVFRTGYYDIDGVTPDNDWATTGYGIKVTFGTPTQANYLVDAQAPNVRIQHVEFANAGQSYDYEQFNLIFGRADNCYVAHSYFYAAQNHVRLAGSRHCVIEYNNIGPHSSTTNHHGENINMLAENYSSGINPGDTTIRYNWFANVAYGDTTGQIIDLTNPGQTNDGVYIYGNIFVDLPGHNGIGSGNSSAPGALTNWKIYNNTFIRSTVNLSRLSTGSELVNNLFYSSQVQVFAGSAPATRRNNYWNQSNNGLGSGTNDVISSEATGTLFVGYAANNYHLGSQASARGRGYALAFPYDSDPDGSPRGDGGWDIGAYEYSGGGSLPTAPTSLSAIVK